MLTSLLRRVLPLLVALAVLPGTALHAQDLAAPAFTLWTYNPADNMLSQHTPDGTVIQTVTLPIGQAFNTTSGDVLLAPDGGYVAYLMQDTTTATDAANINQQLAVYNIVTGTLAAQLPLEPGEQVSLAFRAAPTAYDPATPLLAVGVSGPDGWRVVVLDLLLGFPAAELTSADAISAVVDAAPSAATPVVLRHDDWEIDFLVTADGALPQGYRWNNADGTLTPLPNTYATLTDDLNSADGLVVGPQVEGDGEAIPTALALYDPSTDARTTLYTANDGGSVDRGVFVQGGERVLAIVTRAEGPGEHDWALLGLDGTEVAVVEGMAFVPPGQVLGTPNGYAYLAEDTGGSQVFVVDTRTGVDPQPIAMVPFGARLVAVQPG